MGRRSGTIYDAPPARPYIFKVGDPDLNEQLGGGFQAAHIWVNNQSNQFLWLPDVPDIVPPGVTRVVAISASDVARASWTVPAVFAIAQAANPTGAAILVFLHGDIDITPTPGVATQPSVTITGQPNVAVPGGVNVNNQPGGPVTNNPNVGLVGGSQLSNAGGLILQPTADQLTSGDLGTGADGAVTISADTTLTTDKNYTNLTINNGVTLHTAGFLVRWNGTFTHNGTLDDSGANGTAATSTTNGVGGAGGAGGTLGAGGDGANGTQGTANAGKAPAAGSIEGGAGGAGGNSGGAGGATTLNSALGLSVQGLRSFSYAGGGGGGGGKYVGAGAAIGGGGGGGGAVLAIGNILTGNGAITANGGNAGANFANGSACGGSGGGGGGIAYVACRISTFTGSLSASGGSGAAGSNGGPAGQNGSHGSAGLLVTNA
jgi:hypothetical protein